MSLIVKHRLRSVKTLIAPENTFEMPKLLIPRYIACIEMQHFFNDQEDEESCSVRMFHFFIFEPF